MAKQLTDEEVNLRRKLRRRLIGAAALMLAVVVILPMVLDNEPKATGEDIDLRIPAPDKVGEFVPGKMTEELESASEVVSAVPVSNTAASTVTEAAPPLPPSLPITKAAPIQSAVEKTPTAVTEKKPEPQKTEPKKSSEPAKVAPIKHEVTPAPSHVAPVASDKAGSASGFVAQVGAYGNADTAKHELAQLKAWGFKAYTEKVGDKIRVRVGPYAERDKAEKVQHLLEKHGLHPVVTGAK